MKFTAIIATILMVAQSFGADVAPGPKTFTFELPGLFYGNPDSVSSLTVNLTAVNAGAGTGVKNLNSSITETSNAMVTAMQAQIPDYIKAVKASTSQDCDENCCEDACLALIWNPIFAAICIGICVATHQ